MGYLQDNFRHVLTTFFNTYKPKHIDKVDGLIEEFEGRELLLIKTLCERYFVDFDRFQKKFDEKLTHEVTKKAPVKLKRIETNEAGEEVEIEEEVEDEDFEETVEEAPKKSKKMLIIILLVVVLGGGAGAYFMMGGEETTDSEQVDEVENNEGAETATDEKEEEEKPEAIEDADISMDEADSTAAPKMKEEVGDTSSNDGTNGGPDGENTDIKH